MNYEVRVATIDEQEIGGGGQAVCLLQIQKVSFFRNDHFPLPVN